MFWNHLVRPLLFNANAESVHYAAMAGFEASCKVPGYCAMMRKLTTVSDRRLNVHTLGLNFSNPVGLAAGFDKDARWHRELSTLGFGFIEVGTITDVGQSGNPKPRMFRLAKDQALLNRLGFNNAGADVAKQRLQANAPNTILGINIGKSKVTPNDQATKSYLSSFRSLWEYANYMTINVSSPNTPDLRQLQDREPLLELLQCLQNENISLARQQNCDPKPLLVKIAPDMNDAQLNDVIEICLDAKLTGIIATNTTISRDGLKTDNRKVQQLGAGGISGKPLTEKSRQVVRKLYRAAGDRLTIIGVGGIFDGDDAWRMIAAGASLVQVYTGFIYGGPLSIRNINKRLLHRLDREGVKDLSCLVGQDA